MHCSAMLRYWGRLAPIHHFAISFSGREAESGAAYVSRTVFRYGRCHQTCLHMYRPWCSSVSGAEESLRLVSVLTPAV